MVKGACVAKWGVHGEGGVHGMEACMAEGVCMAGEMATAANSTHPTGMHSCLNYVTF